MSDSELSLRPARVEGEAPTVVKEVTKTDNHLMDELELEAEPAAEKLKAGESGRATRIEGKETRRRKMNSLVMNVGSDSESSSSDWSMKRGSKKKSKKRVTTKSGRRSKPEKNRSENDETAPSCSTSSLGKLSTRVRETWTLRDPCRSTECRKEREEVQAELAELSGRLLVFQDKVAKQVQDFTKNIMAEIGVELGAVNELQMSQQVALSDMEQVAQSDKQVVTQSSKQVVTQSSKQVVTQSSKQVVTQSDKQVVTQSSKQVVTQSSKQVKQSGILQLAQSDRQKVAKSDSQKVAQSGIQQLAYMERSNEEPSVTVCGERQPVDSEAKSVNAGGIKIDIEIYRNFPCKACDKFYSTAACLIVHAETKHWTKSSGTQDCPVRGCSVQQSSKLQLLRHVRMKHTKEQLFNCLRCGMNFTNMVARNSHLRKHLDIGLFPVDKFIFKCKLIKIYN
jgi:hypothetical protein